ncbi:serine/threonine protein kinase [Enhygromyxa salina]|uniref:Serine/threonine protein kinase n=2 Tax=Enhygromyxa salina TaxID=215803 RepID=A0A0C1ZC46_9BACT|nr:serine/threonine protein kinase [Enhygromyxa salina]
MAEVWMGRRQAMGGASKAVAIKLLASHFANNPVYRRMFVDEGRLTMMLTHSNIVQVFDVGEHEGRSYLVMEWVDGMDLSRLATAMREEGQAFELHVIAHVIGEVLRGLAYAHGLTEGDESSTIVHRDISPHNVLISVSGEVKVSDFGVARLASEETSGLHVRGKLRYMPPEQLRGDTKHATTDLFAVGAMLQELLDGVRFRAGAGRDALFGMVVAGEIPPLRRTDVPLELVALRDGLLAKDRGARVQSAGEALTLLRRWPGYRNAADELTALVRGRAGIAAPRTGLTVEFSDEELELEPSDEPTVHEQSGQSGQSGHEQSESQDASDLATRSILAVDEAASETTPQPFERVAGARASGWRRAPVALAVALAVLGVSLGFGYAWLSGTTAASAPSEDAPAAEAPVEPTVVPVPVPVPVPTPVEVSPVPVEAAPVVEASPPVAAPSEPKRRASKVPAAIPAEVEFAAHEFFFVWVKVNGQERALEPVAKLSLPPGRHKVWLRERASDPWVSAGRVKVASGQRYRVSLEKPAGVKLQRLN